MGTRKSTLQIFDISNCAHIAGYFHMTIQAAVLIKNIKALSSDLCWCSCSIFYNQDHTVAVIIHDESAAVISWKGDILKEYWYCILNALIYQEDDGKGHKPDLIVDDGGDVNLLIHEGEKAEKFSLNDGTIPYPSSTDNVEFKIVQTIINPQLKGGETDKWNKIINVCIRFSDKNFIILHNLYTMEMTGTNHKN